MSCFKCDSIYIFVFAVSVEVFMNNCSRHAVVTHFHVHVTPRNTVGTVYRQPKQACREPSFLNMRSV